MSCGRLERHVALWVGGELSVRRAARIAAHVSACKRCRVLADRLRADRRLVAEVADAAPPKETLIALHEGVLARVRSEVLVPRPAVRPLAVRLRWAGALAATLILLAAVGVVNMRRSAHAPGGAMANSPLPSPAPEVSAEASVTESSPASVVGNAPETGSASESEVARARERARPTSRAVASSQRSAKRGATAEALVIKVLTDDPDVVIYWLVDQQKG